LVNGVRYAGHHRGSLQIACKEYRAPRGLPRRVKAARGRARATRAHVGDPLAHQAQWLPAR